MQINCFFHWLLIVPSTSKVTPKETSAVGENFDHFHNLELFSIDAMTSGLLAIVLTNHNKNIVEDPRILQLSLHGEVHYYMLLDCMQA